MTGRRNRKAPEESPGDVPLTNLGPPPEQQQAQADTDDYEDDGDDDVEDDAQQATTSAGGSGLTFAVGAAGAVLLLLMAVWCVVLLPIEIVSWLDERPPSPDLLFKVAGCVSDASAARIATSADAPSMDALRHCIQDSMTTNEDGDMTVGLRLHDARRATERADLGAAERELRSALDLLVAELRNKLSSHVSASWAPTLRVLVAALERKYARAAAVPVGSPEIETVAASVAGFKASAVALRQLHVPAAPTVVSAAVGSAFNAAMQDGTTAAATSLRFGAFPDVADFPGLHSEALSSVDALRRVVERAHDRYDDAQRQRIVQVSTVSVLLAVAIIACVASAIALLLLARRYSGVEQFRQVIRADFEVEEDSPRAIPRHDVLRAFSLAAAKFSVLDTSADVAVDKESSQLVLHLMRAKSTLAALRPFVPAFSYAAGLNFEAFGRLYPRLNMSNGVIKDTAATVVVVGLRDFNNTNASLNSLPVFVAAIHVAAETNRGIVAQITSTHAILLFQSSHDDEDAAPTAESARGNPAITSAGPAIRAAFSILASGVQLQQEDPELSISIAVAHGFCLHGPVSTVSARAYSVISHVVTTAIHLEGICRLLGACLLCDTATATATDEFVLSRPVWICPPRQTNAHEIIMPLDKIGDPDVDQHVRAERAAVRDRVSRWQQCFERYEEAITTMAHEKVEEANGDLQAYRQFVSAQTGSSDVAEDVVFRRVTEHLRRLMSELKI